MKNWAGNLDYSATGVHRPSTLTELAETVASASKVKPLGSRHCFNGIADTAGTHVLLDRMEQQPEIDRGGGVVRVSGSTTYGELAQHLQSHGLALHNMASLPHISLAGALQTGTHGSGIGNGGLASAVKAIELVRASGEIQRLEVSDGRESPDGEFAGSVVALGALGISQLWN